MDACKFLILIIIVGICGCGDSDDKKPDYTFSRTDRIAFTGVGSIGIFDPSITKDPGTSRLWMSYSQVETSSYYPSEPVFTVGVRLAYSDDSGATWTDSGSLTAPFSEAVVGPLPLTPPAADVPASTNGVWNSETSNIIYDPAAPAGEKWKLIWHQYLKADTTSYFVEYSWIGLKMADTAENLAAAATIKLFGGWGLQSPGESTASPAFSPIAGAPQIQLDTDLNQAASPGDVTDLDTCVFAEPGLLAANGAVYCSVMAIRLGGTLEKSIILLKCTDPTDFLNPASWIYISTLVSEADSAAIGFDNHSAPELIEQDGTYYLITTPVTGELYEGTRVYKFTDLDTGQLKRKNGKLVEVLRIDGAPTTHNGCAGYHPDLSGIIHCEFDGLWPDAFKMYQTNIVIP